MKNRSPLWPPLTAAGWSVACAIGLVLAGCAGAPLPQSEMAVAEAAVQRADNPGTRSDAPAELRTAVAKLDLARRAMAVGDADTARRMAVQAQADAVLADGHAQAARARQSAQASQDAQKALREELNRQSIR